METQQQQQQDPHQQQAAQQLQLQQPTILIHEDNMSSGSTSNSKQSSFLCRQSSTRWTPTTDQIRILKDLYYNNGVRSPSAEQIQRISAKLRQYGKIEGKNVFYWFQNHKARERQKKRFTVDMATATMHHHHRSQSFSGTGGGNVVVGGWKQQSSEPHDFSINHHKYTNICPGISSPSSPSHGVLGVGQIGSTSYGSVLMEKSFRDCSISSAGGSSSTTVGGPISSSNNLGWVGIHQQHPYTIPSSSSYPAFFDQNTKPIQHFFTEAAPQAHHEIETLPLFPMLAGGNDVSGFYTEVSTLEHQYPSSGYNNSTSGGAFNFYIPQHHDNKSSSARTSLELTLNSYTSITPDHND